LLALDEVCSLKLVQYVMAALNCFTLIIFYNILRILECRGTFLLAGTAVFAFHPSNIYFASKINNDNTMMFFYVLSFFFLVKWMDRPDSGNIILLAVCTSLAVLTKKSAVMIFVPIGAVFLSNLFKNRVKYLKYIRQYTVFGLIVLPLSSLHTIRNYILFNQSFSYVPSFGQGFKPNLFNLVYLPLGNMLKNPFNNGGLQGGEYFLEFLLKSSLFGEWAYPGLEGLATALLLLASASFIIMAVCILRSKKDEIIKFEYLMLLNLVVPFILEVKFRTDFPVACSQDFRYITPVLISVAYYLGKAAGRVSLQGNAILRYAVSGVIAAFCVLSAVFVLMLRNYS
jgi:hypothetical protein